MSNIVQLELEKIIEEFNKQIEGLTRIEKTWGIDCYNSGIKAGLQSAKEKCERLMEVIVGNYPEQETIKHALKEMGEGAE